MTHKELLEEMNVVALQMESLATSMRYYAKDMPLSDLLDITVHVAQLEGAVEMLEDWQVELPKGSNEKAKNR